MVLRSRHVFRVPLRFLPPQGLIVVRAPWLDWTPLLLRHLGEYYDRIALRGEGGGGGGGGGRNIMTFLGLSHLPWMLHLSGKLF